MSRLAVMANYDPEGDLGPHVRRQVEALAAAVDDVVVVTTSELTDASRQWLRSRVRLIERANYGYDFFSYKVGLASVPDLTAYDEVIVCNDSYVGPLQSYTTILDSMRDKPVDFWGFTETDRVAHHVQSFFVVFRPWTVASQAFRSFWADMVPISNRMQVIRRYEVGMSGALYDAGFRSAPYFVETEADRALARRRVQWWASRRAPLPHRPADVRRWRAQAAEPWNPSAGLADRALDGGRLPYVKIDTLRYDPYGLGADHLLELCEQQFPEQFEGVRDFLEATAHRYPPRPSERLLPTPAALRMLGPVVRYRQPAGVAEGAR